MEQKKIHSTQFEKHIRTEFSLCSLRNPSDRHSLLVHDAVQYWFVLRARGFGRNAAMTRAFTGPFFVVVIVSTRENEQTSRSTLKRQPYWWLFFRFLNFFHSGKRRQQYCWGGRARPVNAVTAAWESERG